MKVILHMGQSKTGTTSLQDTLQDAAERLGQCGILYPSFGPKLRQNQLLFALCGDPSQLGAWFLNRHGGPEMAARVALQGWQQICERIRRTQPAAMVLSSEFLLQHTDAKAKTRMAELLAPLSQDITPVVYLRHPVDHFRARLQQWIKSRNGPFSPPARTLKTDFLDTGTAFGRAPDVVVYDRQTLLGGDVISDFASRYLSSWMDPAGLQSRRTNVGLSAEALVLVARNRARMEASLETERMIAGLAAVLGEFDRTDPPTHPFTLLPEVADAILRSATDTLWLVETCGLQIPGLAVERIDGAPIPDWMQTAPPETLFLHDRERLARLQARVDSSHPVWRKPASQPPESHSRGSLARRFRQFLLRKLAAYHR